MPRRARPHETSRSEHWLRFAVNSAPAALNDRIRALFGWESDEEIAWLSPIISDDYAEYFDQAFLDRIGVSDIAIPLSDFWPRSGPRWDGLARTGSGRLILVEAKAYIEEAVDFSSKAQEESRNRIRAALEQAKVAFAATEGASWETPFYQYANRLAHLYFARRLNGLDAYLLFICFADAPDVPDPCTSEQWEGAVRMVHKCLGLGAHPFRASVGTLIWSVPEMLSQARDV